MTYQDIRKRLVRESVITGAVVAGMVVVVYYFGVTGDDYQQQKMALQNQVYGIRQETNQLQDEFAKVQKNSALYREAMVKNSNRQLTISRQAVREHFSNLRNRSYLNDVHLTMSPVVALTDSEYKRKTAGIESSDVAFNFDAVSDEYVYDMLAAMQQELPGSIRVTDLTLNRTQPLTQAALQAISQAGAFPLVNGQIKFTWFGFISKDSDNALPSKK